MPEFTSLDAEERGRVANALVREFMAELIAEGLDRNTVVAELIAIGGHELAEIIGPAETAATFRHAAADLEQLARGIGHA